jgi:hypothetical protein
MKVRKSLRKWDLRQERLSLTLVDTDEGLAWLEATKDPRILTNLAKIFYPTISAIALEMIFTYRFQGPDWWDALRAYSSAPLSSPPESYLQLCREHDFRNTSERQLYAIVLAGAKDPADQDLLLSILKEAPNNVRDGALWAASASGDRRVMETIAQICMSNIQGGDCTGEIHPLIACFRRWWDRGLLTWDEIEQLLHEYESDEQGKMRVSEVMLAINVH